MKQYLIVSCYNDTATNATWFINTVIEASSKLDAMYIFQNKSFDTIVNIIPLEDGNN